MKNFRKLHNLPHVNIVFFSIYLSHYVYIKSFEISVKFRIVYMEKFKNLHCLHELKNKIL